MKSNSQFLKKYFWDVDFSKLEKDKNSRFIIERILELGDIKSIKWMKKNFPEQDIKKIVLSSRRLSPKSANYWGTVFELDKNKILCLKKLFQEKQKIAWRY